jgi:hypothetical protein
MMYQRQEYVYVTRWVKRSQRRRRSDGVLENGVPQISVSMLLSREKRRGRSKTKSSP